MERTTHFDYVFKKNKNKIKKSCSLHFIIYVWFFTNLFILLLIMTINSRFTYYIFLLLKINNKSKKDECGL